MITSTNPTLRKAVPARVLALSALLLGLGGCAMSPTSAGLSMRLGSPAAAPVGYEALCRRLPAECAVASGGAELAAVSDPFPAASGPSLRPEAATRATSVAGGYDWSAPFGESWRGEGPGWAPKAVLSYSPELMSRLTAVDRDINARIIPASDEEAFGASDVWALPLSEGLGSRGNCKHYVMEKRRALIDAGVPASALSIAVVRTSQGVTHAVLLVSTDQGEFVLDNLSPWVVPWRRAGYTWLIRQAPGRASDWFAVLTSRG